jgi:hypothetical protein
MDSIEWWDGLDPDAKRWLVAHNGESVPADIRAKIEAAGGDVDSEEWWVGESGPEGWFLSDEAVDWIESVANDEAG